MAGRCSLRPHSFTTSRGAHLDPPDPRDNLDADMAPFQAVEWTIREFAEFVLRFNKTVPRHPLGEGNAALVIVRNGTAKVHWLRGKDNHWRVRRAPGLDGPGWSGAGRVGSG
jgi:hypothetical protein